MDSGRIVVRLRESVRLDRYLTARLPHVSRNRIQRHIQRGDVLVDGRRVQPSHRLRGGETLTIPPLAARQLARVAEAIELRIVYEDADLVVVDKPAGLLMHPVGGEARRTLLGGLYRRVAERGESAGELGIVHRLDRMTSGLVVVAKRLETRRRLARQVEERRVRRLYLGVVRGRPPVDSGVVELLVRRDPRRPTRMQALDARAAAEVQRLPWRPHVSSSGYSDPRLDVRPRPARTHYRVLRRFPGASLLRLELDTGRTHQIRVHLQALGTPLLGDPIYGEVPDASHHGATSGAKTGGRRTAAVATHPTRAHGTQELEFACARPALHAARLAFVHPTNGEVLRFASPLPPDLLNLLRTVAAS